MKTLHDLPSLSTGEHLLPGWVPISVVMFIVKIGNVKGSTISQYDEVAQLRYTSSRREKFFLIRFNTLCWKSASKRWLMNLLLKRKCNEKISVYLQYFATPLRCDSWHSTWHLWRSYLWVVLLFVSRFAHSRIKRNNSHGGHVITFNCAKPHSQDSQDRQT